MVVLTFAAPPNVVHDGTGNASSRVVAVGFHAPASLREQSVEISFNPEGPDVAVLSNGRGVVGHRPVCVAPAIAKTIFAAGAEHLGIERRTKSASQSALPKR